MKGSSQSDKFFLIWRRSNEASDVPAPTPGRGGKNFLQTGDEFFQGFALVLYLISHLAFLFDKLSAVEII